MASSIQPEKLQVQRNLPPGASCRRLCITDNVLAHPQFQDDGHKDSHGGVLRRLPTRHSKSFEMPRQRAMEFMERCRPGVRNSDTAENINSLAAMAYGLFPSQKLWNPFMAGGDRSSDEAMKLLAFSQEDVVSIAEDDQAFRTLKASLRQRGCVTNTYLYENLHHYVRHIKDVRERRSRKGMDVRQRSLRRNLTTTAAA